MGVIDKLLNALRLNDDYDDDDDFFDDDEDFDLDEKPAKKKPLFGKKNAKANDEKDDFDDFDDELFDDEPIIRKMNNPKKSQPVKASNVKQRTKTPSAPSSPVKSTTSRISAVRTHKNVNDMSVCVVKPRSMEDAREITETLISNSTVVLNLEGIDVDLAQRIVDFTSGSTYALGGGLQRVSNSIFIITPASVDISGDITDLLNGAFDIPSMNYNY